MKQHITTGQFPDDFTWGVATASYQVEGAVAEDGRTPSIWDTFSHTPGKIAHGHTGDVTCDQYHRYREDVALMRQLGLDSYRFSLSWSRLFPGGGSQLNQKGYEYYSALIEELLAKGIEPAVTLYHWDLPQELEDAGGWPERFIVDKFVAYAERCFDLFPQVKTWITFNEPFCTSILGYHVGVHAPGRTDRPAAYRAIHHLLLAHGKTVQAFRARQAGNEAQIGITLNLFTPRPATRRPEDIAAADRAADQSSRMFLDPILGRSYPQRHLDAYPEVSMPVEAGDMETIAQPIDFLGLNYYWEDAAEAAPDQPEGFRMVQQYQDRTTMGWPVTPEGFYRHIRWVADQTGDLPLYITENGAAFPDRLSPDGLSCSDPQRIDYLRRHLEVCRRAVAEGVPLKGYFLWSFIDNFEWAYGFEQRFGIVYCDYVNQRRVPKDSFYFYRDVVAGMEPV
ncbi:MAG: GH1 family beta-glucosidase [Spirochaetota bacterium]